MEFKRPKLDDKRTRKRFAWFPVEVPLRSRDFVWLESFYCEEVFSLEPSVHGPINRWVIRKTWGKRNAIR